MIMWNCGNSAAPYHTVDLINPPAAHVPSIEYIIPQKQEKQILQDIKNIQGQRKGKRLCEKGLLK